MLSSNEQGEPYPIAEFGDAVIVLSGARDFWWDLSRESGPVGEIALLRVAGDIDLRSLRAFDKALGAAADRRGAAVVVDLTEVGFCSARGFALIIDAAQDGRAGDIDYVVCGLSPSLDRIATLLQSEPCLVRYRDAGAAMIALRAR